MNRIFRRFWPPFFEKLDRWLLLNYPKLWATRIHGLLLALSGFAVLIGLKILMTSYQQVPDVEVDFTVIIIVSVLTWVGWMISMYAFRPGKYPSELARGGQYSLVLLLGTLLVAIMPIVYGMGINSQLDLEQGYSYWDDENTLEFGASYWTYDEQSLESSLHNFKRNRNSSSFNTEQSEQEKLEMAMSLMGKYGGDFGGVTSEQLLASHHQVVVMPNDFRYDVEKAYENLENRRDAGYLFNDLHQLPSFKSEITHILLFAFLLIGLLAIVFQHSSMRQFVWALVAFGVIAIAVGLFAFLNEISNFMNTEKLLSILVFGSYVLVGMIGFGGMKRVKNLQRTGLLLLALAMPFLGFVLSFFGDEVLDLRLTYSYGSPFLLGVLPTVLSLVAWVTVFIPRLQKIQTAPPRK